MRIAINCRSILKSNCTGIGRYTYNLIKELGVLDSVNEYYLYSPRKFFDSRRSSPQFSFNNFVNKNDYFNLGVSRMVRGLDIYHAPSPEFVGSTKKAKIIVTVHDLIFKAFPQAHTKKTISILEQQFSQLVKKADRFICISKASIEDLVRYYSVDRKKISLVYNGVSKSDFYTIDQRQHQAASEFLKQERIDRPFILFVGTIEPRKNLNNLLRAFKILKEEKKFDGKLVVVGMRGWLQDSLEEFIRGLNLNIGQDIIFMGYLSEEQLRYLYNKTEVFVYPYFYEGFGFPILEAFSCGAPVVTSNVSSCSEIASTAAVQINPSDVSEMAHMIDKVIKDSSLKETLKAKGLKRAEEFSFASTATQTFKVYRETMG